MRIFLDTSALAKRYVQEPGSGELTELLTSNTSEIFISTLAFVEFASAMGRKLRNKEIAEAEVTEAIEALKKDNIAIVDPALTTALQQGKNPLEVLFFDHYKVERRSGMWFVHIGSGTRNHSLSNLFGFFFRFIIFKFQC